MVGLNFFHTKQLGKTRTFFMIEGCNFSPPSWWLDHEKVFLACLQFSPLIIILNSITSTDVPAVHRKGFVSADCDTIYTIHLSLCTQSADPNSFRGTACFIPVNVLTPRHTLVERSPSSFGY